MFLAKSGVLDSLTKALSKIQESQPENPMEVSQIAEEPLPLHKLTFCSPPAQFLHANLAVSLDQKDRIRDLERQLNDANHEVTRLKKEVDRLKQQQQPHSRNPFAFMKTEK